MHASSYTLASISGFHTIFRIHIPRGLIDTQDTLLERQIHILLCASISPTFTLPHLSVGFPQPSYAGQCKSLPDQPPSQDSLSVTTIFFVPCDVLPPLLSLLGPNHDQHCPLRRTENGPCFYALLFISVSCRSLLAVAPIYLFDDHLHS